MISRYCYEIDKYHTGTPPECTNCGRCSRFMAKHMPKGIADDGKN